MPYITKDQDGHIVGIFAGAQYDGQEWTDDETVELWKDPLIAVAAKLTQVRAVREAMLNRMTGIALVAQLNGDTVTVDGFKNARQALLDITTGRPTDPDLLDAFIVQKYVAIRAALPDTLIKAFAGVDA